jgi:hypothetical protein
MKELYKTVLLPIAVTAGNHCWDGDRICQHFDNYGGHPTCSFSFNLSYDEKGRVPKPKECLELKEEVIK